MHLNQVNGGFRQCRMNAAAVMSSIALYARKRSKISKVEELGSKQDPPIHQGSIQLTSNPRKHIFDDLEPYICTFGKCSEASTTFKSRREWSKHESTAHEVEFKKRLGSGECPLCLNDISPAKHLSRHIGRHLRELSLASLPPVGMSDEQEDKPKKDIFDRLASDVRFRELGQGSWGESSSKGKEKQG
jgi:hypothetical protein